MIQLKKEYNMTKLPMFLVTPRLLSRLPLLLLVWVVCLLVLVPLLLQEARVQDMQEMWGTGAPVEISLRPPPSKTRVNTFDFNSSKKILYFNNYFHLTDWGFGGFGNVPFVANNCPVSNCYVTRDRRDLTSIADFDAVLFHARDMDRRVIQVPSQERRRPNQRYVFFLMESPLNDGLNYTNKRFHNFFNWTMTYRLDSDIPRPYGWVSHQTGEQEESDWLTPHPTSLAIRERIVKHPKKKLVAWMVSNCNTHSNREDYVELLKQHIPVDVYGACGQLSCPRDEGGGGSSEQCRDMVEQEYRFYLSFENSFCAGYVTEKFYQVLSLDVIPVVLGGGDYKNRAPPHSFINVLDFESPKELAAYLVRLAGDEEEYLSYFWWKAHYQVHSSEQDRAAHSMCRLCERLHESPIHSSSYPSLGRWWWVGGHCTKKGHVSWAKPKSSWADTVLGLFPSG